MALKRTKLRRVSSRQRQKNKEDSEVTKQMHEWFRQIWDEREDEEGYVSCFETGKRLFGAYYRSNTACYDHVLEKNEYEEYRFVKKNIVIIHPDIHTLKHNSIENTPKIKEYRDFLLSLHYENKLED